VSPLCWLAAWLDRTLTPFDDALRAAVDNLEPDEEGAAVSHPWTVDAQHGDVHISIERALEPDEAWRLSTALEDAAGQAEDQRAAIAETQERKRRHVRPPVVAERVELCGRDGQPWAAL